MGIAPLVMTVTNSLPAKDIKELISYAKAKFEALGIEPVGGSPEQAAHFLDDEVAKWAKVISAAAVKAE